MARNGADCSDRRSADEAPQVLALDDHLLASEAAGRGYLGGERVPADIHRVVDDDVDDFRALAPVAGLHLRNFLFERR